MEMLEQNRKEALDYLAKTIMEDEEAKNILLPFLILGKRDFAYIGSQMKKLVKQTDWQELLDAIKDFSEFNNEMEQTVYDIIFNNLKGLVVKEGKK